MKHAKTSRTVRAGGVMALASGMAVVSPATAGASTLQTFVPTTAVQQHPGSAAPSGLLSPGEGVSLSRHAPAENATPTMRLASTAVTVPASTVVSAKGSAPTSASKPAPKSSGGKHATSPTYTPEQIVVGDAVSFVGVNVVRTIISYANGTGGVITAADVGGVVGAAVGAAPAVAAGVAAGIGALAFPVLGPALAIPAAVVATTAVGSMTIGPAVSVGMTAGTVAATVYYFNQSKIYGPVHDNSDNNGNPIPNDKNDGKHNDKKDGSRTS